MLENRKNPLATNTHKMLNKNSRLMVQLRVFAWLKSNTSHLCVFAAKRFNKFMLKAPGIILRAGS